MTRTLFELGSTAVTPMTLAVFVALAAAAFVIARVVGSLVGARLLTRTGVDRGLQYALGRISYYVLLVVGMLVALQTAGVQVGSLTVVLGALGVGIGFGLQSIVNNFVSGLVLLIERPVNVGDWIEVDSTGGRVERIGARSTTILTNDNVTIIVPNAELITGRIINWSHGDPRVRLRLPVGVAYGSRLEAVREALLEVARNDAAVLTPRGAPTSFPPRRRRHSATPTRETPHGSRACRRLRGFGRRIARARDVGGVRCERPSGRRGT
jgi:small-conductance mechanosensitive channel